MSTGFHIYFVFLLPIVCTRLSFSIVHTIAPSCPCTTHHTRLARPMQRARAHGSLYTATIARPVHHGGAHPPASPPSPHVRPGPTTSHHPWPRLLVAFPHSRVYPYLFDPLPIVLASGYILSTSRSKLPTHTEEYIRFPTKPDITSHNHPSNQIVTTAAPRVTD